MECKQNWILLFFSLALSALVAGVVLLGISESEFEPLKKQAVLDPSRLEWRKRQAPTMNGADGPAGVSTEGAGRVSVAGLARAEYSVHFATGEPAAVATFLLSLPGQVLLRGKTDQKGWFASGDCADGVANLLIVAAGSAPMLVEVPRQAGHHVIQLERRAVVSGRVTVDGQEPGQRLQLTLTANRPLIDFARELGLTWKEVGLGIRVATEIRIVAREDGSFLFGGLRPGWSGDLKAPDGYQLRDSALATDPWRTIVGLERPIENLVFELTKPIRIVGRVVRTEGGEAVADARIYPALVYADGSKSRYMLDDVRAGSDGRFELALANAQLRGTSLRVCTPTHMAERVLPIEAIDLTSDLDLGDIPMWVDRGQLQLDVQVKNHEGDPIKGAIVRILDAVKRTSIPTNDEGYTAIAGLEEGVMMARVLSMGYEIEEVPAYVGPNGGELVVTMRASTLLRVRFLASDGTAMRNVSCAITTSEFPFERESDLSVKLLFGKMGASHYWPIDRGDGVTLRYSLLESYEADRRVVVSGIKPGLPMQLLILGGGSGILEQRELAALQPAEQRDVDVVLDQTPRTLSVRVVDFEGEPLARAFVGINRPSIDLSRLSGPITSVRVGPDGSCEFTEIFCDHLDFHASCEGYVPFRNPELRVPPDGSVVEIRLEKGREVLVTIENEKGRPLDASVVARLPNGARVVALGSRAGQYLLRGLPSAPIKVFVQMGGTLRRSMARHMRDLGAHETELHLVFPVAGRVEGQVTLPLGVDPQNEHAVLLVPVDKSIGWRSAWIQTVAQVTSTFVFEDVISGHYKVYVRRRGPGLVYDEVLGDSVAMEVKPEKTTVVELSPPLSFSYLTGE